MTLKISDEEYIPKDFLDTTKNRKKIGHIIFEELRNVNKITVVDFSSRVALRTYWILQSLKVNDSKYLDRFYYYWINDICRIISLQVSIEYGLIPKTKEKLNLIRDNKINYNKIVEEIGKKAYDRVYVEDALKAVYVTYAAFRSSYTYNFSISSEAATYGIFAHGGRISIDELNYDLFIINDTNEKLINKPLWKNKVELKKLKGLDDLWIEYIFNASICGDLMNDKTLLFITAFLDIPEEIHESESAYLMAQYIQNFIDGKLVKTNESRLILLGNGGAGKTSLVKLIRNKFEENGKYEQATPRVSVSSLKLKDLKISIWDFGGQVIMHSTHGFFISSKSTYIIICNQRANEQPDEWLDIISSRNNENGSNVIIVYSHCNKKINNSWIRECALKRKYKNIKLEFESIDMRPDVSPEKIKYIFNDTRIMDLIVKNIILEANESQQSKEVFSIKEIVDENEKKGQAYISYIELKKALLQKEVSTKNLNALLRSANAYGYIFPVLPFDLNSNEELNDDFILINQRHWLTYGIYQLVNSNHAQEKNGILNKAEFKTALNNGKPIYITYDGKLNDEKPLEEKYETVFYDDLGIDILIQIIINYRWGFMYSSRHNEILFPLSTRLDEPSNLDSLYNTIEVSDKDINKLRLVFTNKPKDFFFRLTTYLVPHLIDVNHLWRTGAVLHFYGNTEDVALLEVEKNIINIEVKGNDKDNFLQLLLINIKHVLKAYQGLSVTVYENICIEKGRNGESKYEMISSDIIDNLINSNDEFLKRVRKNILERGSRMTNITINNNGGNAVNQLGKKSVAVLNDNAIINEKAEILMGLLKQAEASAQASYKNEILSIIDNLQTVTETKDIEKKEKLFKKVVDGAKNFTSLEKGISAFGKHLPNITETLNGFIF